MRELFALRSPVSGSWRYFGCVRSFVVLVFLAVVFDILVSDLGSSIQRSLLHRLRQSSCVRHPPDDCGDSAGEILRIRAWPGPDLSDHPDRSAPMLNRASKRSRLPGYSRRRNLYWPMAACRALSLSKLRPISASSSRDRECAGIGFAGSRRAVINPAVGGDHTLIFVPGALGWREVRSALRACARRRRIACWPRLQICPAPGGQHRKQQQEAEPCPDAVRVGLDRRFSIFLARSFSSL